jgi:hypothetical protein
VGAPVNGTVGIVLIPAGSLGLLLAFPAPCAVSLALSPLPASSDRLL